MLINYTPKNVPKIVDQTLLFSGCIHNLLSVLNTALDRIFLAKKKCLFFNLDSAYPIDNGSRGG
jgi:hypothetical protein